jgi:hypothetical protein
MHEIVGKLQTALRDSAERAEQHDAVGRERLEAYRVRCPLQAAGGQSTVGPDHHPSRHIQKAGLGQPDELVAAPITANEVSCPAGCKENASSRQGEILGYLPAGLGAANDKNCPRIEAGGIAVLGCIELMHPVRQFLRRAGPFRDVLATGRNNQIASPQRFVRAGDKEAAIFMRQSLHAGVQPHGQAISFH